MHSCCGIYFQNETPSSIRTNNLQQSASVGAPKTYGFPTHQQHQYVKHRRPGRTDYQQISAKHFECHILVCNMFLDDHLKKVIPKIHRNYSNNDHIISIIHNF